MTTTAPPDPTSVLVPGPWEHRYVSANGSRFHVAEAGSGPLVLLLHGFPLFWWTWRHQIEEVARAGWRVAAMDLRGYGASDKPPQGYDTRTLAADAASVIRSLGAGRAVVVGHGTGAWVAWSMPHLEPDVTHAIAVMGVPHPSVLRRPTLPALGPLRTGGPVARTLTSRGRGFRLAHDPDYVPALLRRWSSPRSPWPEAATARRLAAAMSLPFAARSAGEAQGWLMQAPFRPAGRAFLRQVCAPVRRPVLQVHGADDPLCSATLAARSARHVRAPYTWCLLPRTGHFPHEENPTAVTTALLDWLPSLLS